MPTAKQIRLQVRNLLLRNDHPPPKFTNERLRDRLINADRMPVGKHEPPHEVSLFVKPIKP